MMHLQPLSTAMESDYEKSEAAKAISAQGAYQVSMGAQDPYRATGDVRGTEEWATHEAPNGKAFYHNLLTGATQWEKPAALETQNHAQVVPRYYLVCFLITISAETYILDLHLLVCMRPEVCSFTVTSRRRSLMHKPCRQPQTR